MIKKIILFLYLIILASCQTTPQKEVDLNELQSAEFKGYISIKDLKKGKSYLVNFKNKIVKYDFLRLDVTAPFIGHLASLSVLKRNIQFVVPSERKYYSGPADSRHLKSILPFELDSIVLFHAFWGTAISKPGWACDTQKLPNSCTYSKEKIQVHWERKLGVPSKIKISHPYARLEFLISGFEPNIKNLKLNAFNIPNPGY